MTKRTLVVAHVRRPKGRLTERRGLLIRPDPMRPVYRYTNTPPPLAACFGTRSLPSLCNLRCVLEEKSSLGSHSKNAKPIAVEKLRKTAYNGWERENEFMITKLTIENFKSFLESTTIDFASGTASKLPGNLLRHRNGERFVKSMALYGPNASGKTTVLDGLYALGNFALFSSRDQKPTSQISGFQPFALDQASSKRPTRIALTIDLEGARYTLDVSATSNRVWNEVLNVQRTTTQPSRRTKAKLLIERNWEPDKEKYSTTLHKDLGTELTRSAAIEQTTPKKMGKRLQNRIRQG